MDEFDDDISDLYDNQSDYGLQLDKETQEIDDSDPDETFSSQSEESILLQVLAPVTSAATSESVSKLKGGKVKRSADSVKSTRSKLKPPPRKRPKLQTTTDTTELGLRLKSVILKSVLSGQTEPIERVVQTSQEPKHLCLITNCKDSVTAVTTVRLLDFVARKLDVPNVPVAYSFHSPLMIACEEEREDMVKVLLDNGASPAFRNKDKLSALHIACNKGNKEIVELLLNAASKQKILSKGTKHSSDNPWMINGRNHRGWSPLMFAIKGGHIDIINRLLQTGLVNYKATSRKGCNVLHFACRGSSLECFNAVFTQCKNVETLILATDKNGWNVIHHASASRNVKILKQLLSLLGEENRTKLINQRNKAGYTPLLVATEYQCKHAIEPLIAHGADTSLCAKDGDKEDGEKSGLHVAAIHDSKDIAKKLIDKECPMDIQDSEGNSALHVAHKKSSFEVITVLRQRDDGKLETLENKKGVHARNIVPDDVIPPEITKRGKEAIDLYKKALKEGKKKIPRCNLLILGQERVGKTSVYRLLVGLGFDPEQDPTLGIENKSVSIMDTRILDTKSWKEKDDDMQKKQSKEEFADVLVAEVRDKLPPKRKDPTEPFEPISNEQLQKEVEDIISEIEQRVKENPVLLNDSVQSFVPIALQHKIPWTHSQQPQQASSKPKVTTVPTSHSHGLNPMHHSLKKKPEVKSHIQGKSKPPAATELADYEVPKVEPATKPTAMVFEDSLPLDTSEQPAPPSPVADSQASDIGPKLDRQQLLYFNKRLKSTSQDEEEPSLDLNTLDFAGQPEYRPMHHCFIRRRGMYLVVFNLQDMVIYLEAEDKHGDEAVLNPLEEIRYWIHSIHAHIYPPDEDERGRDEKMSRVCLVGTHRAPNGREITNDELKAIDELLRKELLSDDRCVDHIHRMEGNEWIFVPVENSIDGTDDDDRKDSGAFQLQQKMKSVIGHLAFLQEDYPIIWLQFESELMRQREYRKERSQSMVISLEKIQSWAFQQGITAPEAQNLAFQFFHDIGKIVYFKQTPTLFLSEDEWKQLTELVILDPTWIIDIMKVLFEKDMSKGAVGRLVRVPERLKRDLKNTGVASTTLLKECWKEFTDGTPVSFHQLCLMLQANCLIYPVPSSIVSAPTRANTDPLPQSDTPVPSAPARSQTDLAETSDSEKFFLVPHKLPEKPPETPDKPGCQLPWIKFYFDFQKFLPNEIFHRFICIMLADPDSKKSKKNIYYSTCCQFYNIDGCNWKIELQRNLYRLKVSVLPKEGDKRAPSYFIKKVHEEYLLKICQASHLQGLEYYGGPFVKCANCGEEEIVEYVGYAHGRPQKPPREDLWCTNCPKKHNIDELLKPQPAKDSPTPLDVREPVQIGKPLPDTQSSSAASKDGATPSTPSTQPSTSKPPTLKTLTIIKWNNEKGEIQKHLRIMREVSPKWREAGRMLGIEAPQLEVISIKQQNDPGECCCDVFIKWLDGACSDDYPVTWAGLIELLQDLEKECLANNLERALQFLNIEY